MKKNLFKTLLIIFIFGIVESCQSPLDPASELLCQLSKISSTDGSSTTYKYNSDKKWKNITVSDGKSTTTYSLDYEQNKPKGPVFSIYNEQNGSISFFDYNNDDVLIKVITKIDKMDMGTILGYKATGTNFKTVLDFKWNSEKQLVRRDFITTVDITTNNRTDPFSFSGYETFEYDVSDRLVKTNIYSNEKIVVVDKVIVDSGLVGFTIIEYENKSTKFSQSLGLTNLALDIGMDGQVVIEPVTGYAAVSRITLYIDDGNGSVKPYVTNYVHTTNASGFLSKTEVDSDVITYTYSNCK
jgi:YD repeat-containing protein